MKSQRTNFTIIELIAVLAIISLVVGFIITRAHKVPAFLSLDASVNQVRKLFFEASNQSRLRGEEVVVEYKPETRVIKIIPAKSPDDNGAGLDETHSTGPAGRLSRRNYRQRYSYTFPKDENFKIEFPHLPLENTSISYHFYADGSAGGPDMLLKFKGHAVKITISPLTGMVNIAELDDNENF